MTLRAMAKRPEKELQRGIPVALLKLGDTSYADQVVEIILGADERQAINACYLCLRIDRAILNEKIISAIHERGEPSRQLAITRFSESGGPCQEQLDLLAGRLQTVAR
jgi:hypothetical protein